MLFFFNPSKVETKMHTDSSSTTTDSSSDFDGNTFNDFEGPNDRDARWD